MAVYEANDEGKKPLTWNQTRNMPITHRVCMVYKNCCKYDAKQWSWFNLKANLDHVYLCRWFWKALEWQASYHLLLGKQWLMWYTKVRIWDRIFFYLYTYGNFNPQNLLLFPKLFFRAIVKDILYPRVGKWCHCSGTSIIIQNSTLLLKILTLQGLRYLILQNHSNKYLFKKANPYIYKYSLNIYFNCIWLQVSPKPNTFMPFGNGVHSCPGNELAKLNMFILIHHLVTKYR